ncbi:MAG: DUF3990 domain-containing protein [Treponemataceae bacterium]|nr:DUF3990 domain-containing protein [Treponemataceae bacterium]
MNIKTLFHTSFQVIEKPDIKHGRANADFGQGFYLSDNEDFSKRWAENHNGMTSKINTYTLDIENLKVKIFHRDNEWFKYISDNRMGKADSLAAYDLIIGPIANDTLYDTYGVITSGLLSEKDALSILRIGPEYNQIVIKTQKAADVLKFEKAFSLDDEEIAKYKIVLKEEEKYFQEKFNEIVGKLDILD